jgi:1-acyl-sn-glycerol-3-phosphate acyltransferase
MEALFLNIYDFFRGHRKIFWCVFIGAWIMVVIGASRIKIEEDITRFFPDDERIEHLNYIFKNSKLSERLVFMVSVKDSTTMPQPDSLIRYTQDLVTAMQDELKPYVASITSEVEDSKVMAMIEAIQDNLPLFLEEEDYQRLDSLSTPANVMTTLVQNYRQLISPTGIVTKRIIARDPLGFSYLALKKLQRLQYDDNIEIYNGFLLSRDHRHLIFFVQPVYAPANTGKNVPFIRELDMMISGLALRHPEFQASYFGATAVAAGNASQIQSDTILTLSLMVLLLAVFLIGFFRKKRVPFLILIPVVFGALFSLCAVYLIQGTISVLAIAAGSIILGIAVNYSLHFLAHLKHTGDVSLVIRDLVKPMTLGSATTVLAFLCLQFVNASVLQDLGLFAAFSLIGASFCSLIFLPHLISDTLFSSQSEKETWIDRIAATSFESKGYLVLIIFLLTPVFLYFAKDVRFNTDIGQLNYMRPDLRESQDRLESINRASLSSVYIVSQDSTLEKALRKNEHAASTLRLLNQTGDVQKYSSISSFMISDSLQQLRLQRWRNYWTGQKVETLMRSVREQGEELKFSEKVYSNFNDLLVRTYEAADTSVTNSFRKTFFDDYIIEKDGLATVISLAHVAPEKKEAVYDQLSTTPARAFDRQMLANIFTEYVHADFNFIVTFTSLLVFFALLLSYGRIELTLITFVPMLITWVWILGIMALAGIEFNIVNVMISTFIFGLGDDYSIFIMDGLQQEYKLARKNLPSIRTSILLSALTTISGLGVLIFAKHPALRSIAGISIIGIVCVFVMSQTIEPFLFRWLITKRTTRHKPPMTFWGLVMTFFLYSFFIFGSFFLTLVGIVLKLIPGPRKNVRFFYHSLIRFYTWLLVRLGANIKLQIQDQIPGSFSRAHVIISNHSSFLDILFMVMLHPKLILLTNKWVWDSPVFGGVVRLADYYPVMEGAEDSIEQLKALTQDGYSIVVFPEGTRSTDGLIHRFHKGAFYIAELLKLPVQPILNIGAGDAIPKGDYYVNHGYVTLKFLPAIELHDAQFGYTYSEKTKAISRYFRNEYGKLCIDRATPERVAHKVINNYLYKGPVLEWYMRIKLKLEKNYEPFNNLIPRQARILDLGCGYGFLCYMLSFLSAERQLTGVDYDEEKVMIANTCYSKNESIRFFASDITQFPIAGYDIIIIADVLHYLLPEAQEVVLRNCFNGLASGGKIIIREGNADLKERHKGTRITELFSVKLLKFNKSANELYFLSGEKLRQIAKSHGFEITVVDETRFTSNVIFVLSHPGSEKP